MRKSTRNAMCEQFKFFSREICNEIVCTSCPFMNEDICPDLKRFYDLPDEDLIKYYKLYKRYIKDMQDKLNIQFINIK